MMPAVRYVLAFSLALVEMYSHLVIMPVAWLTTAYILPLYVLIHVVLAACTVDLPLHRLLEEPIAWLSPRKGCPKFCSILLRLTAAASWVSIFTKGLPEGSYIPCRQNTGSECAGLPSWLLRPWWSGEPECPVKFSEYHDCLDRLPFYQRGLCHFQAGFCNLDPDDNHQEWPLGPVVYVGFVGPLVAALLALLLRCCCFCCCATGSADDEDEDSEASEASETNEHATCWAQVKFLVTLMFFYLYVLSNFYALYQFVKTGNVMLANVSAVIFTLSICQQIKRGVGQKLVSETLESCEQARLTPGLERIFLSEKSLAAPLQLWLQFYALYFMSGDEWAIRSFVFFPLPLSLIATADAAIAWESKHLDQLMYEQLDA